MGFLTFYQKTSCAGPPIFSLGQTTGEPGQSGDGPSRNLVLLTIGNLIPRSTSGHTSLDLLHIGKKRPPLRLGGFKTGVEGQAEGFGHRAVGQLALEDIDS